MSAYKKNNKALIIFAKEPKSANIKTRLKRVLSLEQRLKLYEAFLKDIKQIGAEVPQAKKILAFDCKGCPEKLKKIFKGFVFTKQKGRDLGRRMHYAFCLSKQQGVNRTVIIGTDAPDLPVSFVRNAFARLKSNDLVLGPCQDGGYYLIGLKEPCKELFGGIPWSSDQVFQKTLHKANKLRLKVAILPKWQDVDYPDDIKDLKERIRKKKKIAKYTKEYFYGTSGGHYSI